MTQAEDLADRAAGQAVDRRRQASWFDRGRSWFIASTLAKPSSRVDAGPRRKPVLRNRTYIPCRTHTAADAPSPQEVLRHAITCPDRRITVHHGCPARRVQLDRSIAVDSQPGTGIGRAARVGARVRRRIGRCVGARRGCGHRGGEAGRSGRHGPRRRVERDDRLHLHEGRQGQRQERLHRRLPRDVAGADRGRRARPRPAGPA